MTDKKIKRAIITAAGFGSRFLPITKTFPKEMLPIIDKPIIQYLVEECAEAGIDEVIIVAAPAEVTKFEDYFYGSATNIRTLMIRQGKLDRWEKVEKVFKLPKITIVPQDDRLPYGNGRPVLTAKDLVEGDEAFVVLFGDDLVLSEESSVKQIIDHFNSGDNDGVIGAQKVAKEELSKYGIVKIAEGSQDQVEYLVEKPEPEEAPSDLASYGRYVLTPKVFEYLKADATGKDGELWIADAIDEVAKHGVVRVKAIDGEWMTTGDPLNYMKAHIQFMLKNDKYGSDLKEFMESLT
jgi:UTP--glucose-1-phosphate uridylyltransferase